MLIICATKDSDNDTSRSSLDGSGPDLGSVDAKADLIPHRKVDVVRAASNVRCVCVYCS